jgi:hypothetical protein
MSKAQDISGALEVAGFEEQTGGTTEVVDAEPVRQDAASLVGATSPTVPKAKRVSAKFHDRNMWAIEAVKKAGVT